MKNTSILGRTATVRACDVRINLPSTANPFAVPPVFGNYKPRQVAAQELVNAIDPNIHYKEAVRILKAIHFETNGGDDGIEIAAQWCLKETTFKIAMRLKRFGVFLRLTHKPRIR